MLLQPFRNIGYFVSSYSRAVAGGSRIFNIMDTPSEVRNREKAIVLTEAKGTISFENVFFSYEGGRNVLEDINLTVNKGESIAILGPTGSGKSTLVYLIPRFYDVASGRITLDDRDVRDYTLESLRSQIGIVLQDIFLFSSSIKENIAFGRPEASMDDIVKAAKAAQAHDFIIALPKGYETMVGERGLTLSGGQRQRIAIARTLLTDSRLLILDDSTSFVDAETEASIQKALDRLLQGRTSFIITHRLSTIRRVDRLVVLDKGRISEVGTHEELLKRGGTYSRIYETQFAEVERLSVQSDEGRR
jgi:ABC-type multidrug transport system fused ATPase/permease subunit